MSTTSPEDDLGSRVRVDMSSFPKSTRPALLGVLRRWYYVSLLRLLIMECRNFFHHIGFAIEMRELEIRNPKDSVPTGLRAPLAFQSQTCKRAYIHYMQQLRMEHPQLTILDLLLIGRT